MVHELPQTRLSEFDVTGNIISRDGKEITRFPTPICQLARLNEYLFVVLHPYPADQQKEYAGTNLWALDMAGNILWKAENLNVDPQSRFLNNYAEIYLFDVESPKVFAISSDERISAIFDIASGRKIPRSEISDQPIRERIFAKAVSYLMPLPTEPPERSHLRPLEPTT